MEQFFSPNSGEDQKKGLHQKWNTFSSAFQWTPVLRCTPESNYWGGYSQIIGGYFPPSPPGFGTADFSSQPLAGTALQVIMVNRP